MIINKKQNIHKIYTKYTQNIHKIYTKYNIIKCILFYYRGGANPQKLSGILLTSGYALARNISS